MCVCVGGQPVSPGPILIREKPSAYTIGGIAFGASDCMSDVRADVFDAPGEDSANAFTIDDWHSIGTGMKGWTIEQVENFVQGLAHEFGEKTSVYADTLKREDIDGKVLLDLSEDDLKHLGFSLGHRRKLLACIQRSS